MKGVISTEVERSILQHLEGKDLSTSLKMTSSMTNGMINGVNQRFSK